MNDDTLKLNPLNRPVVGKELRELAAEQAEDYRAARVRDGGEEIAGMIEAIAVPPRYDDLLKDSASRGSNRTEGKGQER